MNEQKGIMPEEKDIMQLDPDAGPGADIPAAAKDGGKENE